MSAKQLLFHAAAHAKILAGMGTLANAVRANVQLVVQQLRRSRPILADQIRDHKIRIVGAVYELDSGSVMLLPE